MKSGNITTTENRCETRLEDIIKSRNGALDIRNENERDINFITVDLSLTSKRRRYVNQYNQYRKYHENKKQEILASRGQ